MREQIENGVVAIVILANREPYIHQHTANGQIEVHLALLDLFGQIVGAILGPGMMSNVLQTQTIDQTSADGSAAR